MKFSTLAIASLTITTSAAALSKEALKTLVQEEVVSAMHAHRMLVHSSTNHRQLQEDGTTCDAAFIALSEDEALAAATEEYLVAYQSLAETLDISECDTTETSISCDFSNSGPSTTDLESGCTALGGTIEGYDSNVACTMTVEGESVSFFLNAAPLYLCIPTVEGEDCKAEADATSAQVNELVDAELESALSLAGFAASCEVGTDVTSDMPGSGVAVARGLTALTGTAVAMAFVLL
jgi:hypothetical protein